jgi:plasmid stability protein
MGTLTIRDLDESVKQRLREHAATQGLAMENVVRRMLRQSVMPRRRKGSIFDELTRLGVKPDEPFDQKKFTDDLWDEGLL